MTSTLLGPSDATAGQSNEERHQVIVVGAGVTGLAAGVRLKRAGVDVMVCDGATVAGGVMRSTWSDGRLTEWGPHSMQGTPDVMRALEEFGLSTDVVHASAQARRRYVLHDGRPVALPGSPLGLVRSPLLSARGKLRLLAEAFLRPRHEPGESVGAFARRRFGAQVAERLVSAFVAGVYAADTDEIAIEHAFPSLHDLERSHGSVLRGLIRHARASKRAGVARPGSISLARGMGQLPETLARLLGSSLQLGRRLVALRREPDGRWRVELRESAGYLTSAVADEVVLALPAHEFTTVAVPDEARRPFATIASTPHAAVSVWTLAFHRADVAHALDGFGVLVPHVERRTILGALFSSSMFAGRAAGDQVLLSAFVRDDSSRARASVDDVLADLRRIVGVRGEPLGVDVHSHAGIPLKGAGHRAVLDAAEAIESVLPGVRLAGSWRSGVAVGECLAAGQRVGVRTK